jgi:DNA topoisomerase-1
MIEDIRKNYTIKMKSPSTTLISESIDRQLGTATYLIDRLALRVGNEKSEDEADTVGTCSLRVEHIKIEEDC